MCLTPKAIGTKLFGTKISEKNDRTFGFYRFCTPNRTILEQFYGRLGEDLGIENIYTRPNYTTLAIPLY